MTEGIPADGAPARVPPEDFIVALDQLFAVWVRLNQLARLHDDEAARILAEYRSFTVGEAVEAWREVNRKMTETVHRLEWIETTMRGQRDGIVGALETAAQNEENES
ncbi:hypothetical protein [Falsiroseomonas oryzae]|uniref:hypothetical protein n=1 Tax=Falsiroseomonas oryzae TaxID=2766473 RepID=UPI0022EA68F4|nr:hypothetical protein [Roseomonas sp. MO-31]